MRPGRLYATSIVFVTALASAGHAAAMCDITMDRYLSNREEIKALLDQKQSRARDQKMSQVEQQNLRYRVCMSALVFHATNLAEQGKEVVLDSFFGSTANGQDLAVDSLRVVTLFVQNKPEAIAATERYFADYPKARKILFIMNEVLFREVSADEPFIPQTFKSRGSYTAIFSDLLTRNYASNKNLAAVFDRLVTADDLGHQYLSEYAEYARKNVPQYRQYPALKQLTDRVR